jgi:hypothetical protein
VRLLQAVAKQNFRAQLKSGSLLPQSPHRIEARSARRGDPCGEQTCGHDHEQARGIRARIGDANDSAIIATAYLRDRSGTEFRSDLVAAFTRMLAEGEARQARMDV